jgi:hypothetical protein
LFLKLAGVGVLLAVILVGAEGSARLFTPRWPAYMLRPAPVSARAVEQWQAGMPEATFTLNSWQMRDRERSVAKRQGIALRSLFIGDSVLDGSFSRSSIPSRVEALLRAASRGDVEAINLGVTSTGPVEYYYRLQRVGLELSADAVVMLIFPGNDLVYRRFGDEPRVPPLIDELPMPSVLGTVAPHLTWWARQAAGLVPGVEAPGLPDEQATIDAAMSLPIEARVRVLSGYMKEYYFPALDQDRIAEILSRGGDTFWLAFAPRRLDREFLPAGFIRQMIASETAPPAPAAVPGTASVEATLSWIVAAEKLARRHGVRFMVALAPVPVVDPEFVSFWRYWPHYNDYNVQRDGDHRALAMALSRTSIPVVDLRDNLGGVPGAYRKTDMHWTEQGNDIVAARFAGELAKLQP